MTLRHHVLRCVWIVTCLPALAGGAGGPGTPVLTGQTLARIRECLAASPAPWPQAWCDEYVDVIRDALDVPEEPSDFARRLEALSEGFPAYWDALRKGQDRALFEVQCAEITWYAERLMGPAFPSEQDKQTLGAQWEDLWDNAAGSLVSQFSFLDPRVVKTACRDHLAECQRCIEAPLKPIFQRPFSPAQIDRIREGWHELRYARVDLMRELGGEDLFLADRRSEGALDAHPDYVLTQRSLEQWVGYMQTVIVVPSEAFREAVQNYRDAKQRRRQRVAMARVQERRLGAERFRRLDQVEALSFLLAVVLESSQQFRSLPADGAVDSPRAEGEETSRKEVMPMR